MKVILFANTDWYLYNFRLSLALSLRNMGFEVLLLSPKGPYAALFAGLGLRWRAAPMVRRSLNPWTEAKFLLGLANLIRREKADLVHGFTLKSVIYGALAGRFASVTATVGSVDGLGYVFTSDDFRARILRPLVRGLLKFSFVGSRARLIVLNNTDLRFFLDARLVDAKRARVIAGSGVDCDHFRPATKARCPGPLRVLLATRLLWDKGLREFAEAARRLKAESREIDFILAGDADPGNPASVPREVVSDWEREGLLRWIGHVDDMAALLADVDVFVLPSYREGLSKSLIEAAACGKALITTDVPGCRDVVTDGRDGLLVPAREAGPLAAAIARLDDDRTLILELGEAARRRAIETFDGPIVVAQTLDVYREIMSDLTNEQATLEQVDFRWNHTKSESRSRKRN